MKLSRHAITVLTRQYKSVLLKCALINAGLFLAVAPAMAEDVSTWDALKSGVEAGENITLTGNINLTGSETRITANSTSEQSINLGEYKIDGNSSSLDTNLIQATATDLTINNGEFSNLNRTTDWGSVLHLTSGGNLTINDTDFTHNKSLTAGVLSVGTAAGSIAINGSTFENNEAGEIGAIGLYKAGSFENVTFMGNKATNTTGDGTGALFLGSVSTAGIGNTVNGSVFQSNTSATRAGAIGMRDFDLGNNSGAALDIDNTKFISNIAKTNGGAIDNYFYNDSNNDGYAKVTNSEFTYNQAEKGGAIYNHKGGAIKVAGQDQVANMSVIDSNFLNNKATADGGAIYNEGVFTVAANTKDVDFSGNTDSNGKNDIYNLGTLNLAAAEGKKISFEGGISGDANNKGTTNISGEGAVVVSNTLTNQNVKNDGKLQLDGASLEGTEITGDGSLTVIGDSSMEGDITLEQKLTVNKGQELEVSNAIITGTTPNGAFDNKGGVLSFDTSDVSVDIYNEEDSVLNITDSTIGGDVYNKGIMYSDPTTYSGTVDNTGLATFDADTFASTAVLSNSGVANLENGVTFESGATITGTGTTNLVNGITHFNDTANTNIINLANGANFDGKLKGGMLNTQNGAIDDILGSIDGVDVALDVNTTSLTADKFASAANSTITSVNVSGSYGTYSPTETKTIAVGGDLTLADDAEINGGYYTKVESDGAGNLVFSDKLVNTSAIQGTGDATTPAGDVVLGSVAATTTVGASKAQIALDNTAETATITAKNGVNTTGNLTVGGNLGVTGSTYLHDTSIDGTLYTTGTASVGGDLGVAGTSYLHNTSIDGTLYTTGTASVGGDLGVKGTSYLHDTNVDGALTTTGAATIGDKLTVKAGGADITGTTTTTGGLYAAKDSNGVYQFQVGSTGNVYVGVDKFTVDATDGSMSAAAGKFTVDENGNANALNITAQGDLGVQGSSWLKDTHVNGAFEVSGQSYLHNTSVTGDLAVTGTTKTTALTFDGTSYVAAMDQGDAAITSGTVDDQAKRTMATNATVAKTVGNLAALENKHGVTSVADIASAIDSLATNIETATGGTFANAVWTGTVTGTKAVNYAQGVAYNNLLSSIDQISSNIGTATNATYGNIASDNTVNANLDSLDAAIGDRSFATTTYVAPHDDLSTAVTKLDKELHTVNHEVRELRHDMNRGLASVAALSALVPNARGTGNTSLSVGTGYYHGQTAMALGGAHWFTDNLMVNIGVASTMGHTRDATYRAGVSYSF